MTSSLDEPGFAQTVADALEDARRSKQKALTAWIAPLGLAGMLFFLSASASASAMRLVDGIGVGLLLISAIAIAAIEWRVAFPRSIAIAKNKIDVAAVDLENLRRRERAESLKLVPYILCGLGLLLFVFRNGTAIQITLTLPQLVLWAALGWATKFSRQREQERLQSRIGHCRAIIGHA